MSLPAQACTLRQYVEGVQRDHSGMRVSLAVEGMDAYFRSVVLTNTSILSLMYS